MNPSGSLLGRGYGYDCFKSNRKSLISLIVGLVVGFCLSQLFVLTSRSPDWFTYDGQKPDRFNDAHNSFELLDAAGPEEDIGTHDHSDENNTIAVKLSKEVRVLCWIMTNPQNHQKKARHVRRTWGKRCNILLFMSSAEDPELQSIALPVKEGRDYLWAKTKEAFKYIYHHHFHEADWFYKADDDTYAVVENLRYMLYPYDPATAIYFGCRFKPFVKQGYMSGGAGYVLSREAVRRLVEVGLTNPKLCSAGHGGSEDVEMGKCLQNVKVKAGDSRDALSRGRFFPFVPEHHLIPAHSSRDYWYWKYIYYKTDEGLDCCSDNAISFHYVSPNQMYVLDYLIYHLHPYGIIRLPAKLPDKLKIGEVMPTPKEILPQTTTTAPSYNKNSNENQSKHQAKLKH